MLRRIEWAAVLAVLLSVLAITAVSVHEEALGVVLALGGVMWAILSLRERT